MRFISYAQGLLSVTFMILFLYLLLAGETNLKLLCCLMSVAGIFAILFIMEQEDQSEYMKIKGTAIISILLIGIILVVSLAQ